MNKFNNLTNILLKFFTGKIQIKIANYQKDLIKIKEYLRLQALTMLNTRCFYKEIPN